MDRIPRTQVNKTNPVFENEVERLSDRRDALIVKEPKLRGRGLADRLSVSEAQIVALECGSSARALRPEWSEIIGRLHSLGTVMALTRNEWVLHEKIGRYGEVCIDGSGKALLVGEEINLRLCLDQWRYGFAVREGVLNSLQFFDSRGDAVHKVYLLEESDVRAFNRLTSDYIEDDDAQVVVDRRPNLGNSIADNTLDLHAFRSDWDSLGNINEFKGLLIRHRLTRSQALSLAGKGRAIRLPVSMFRRTLEIASERQVPVVVGIENRGTTQIHAGVVTNLSKKGSWLNVIDPTFNLHLFEDAIRETWAVKRPTSEGTVLALEAIDAAGDSIATLFGTKGRDYSEDPRWLEVLKSSRRTHT